MKKLNLDKETLNMQLEKYNAIHLHQNGEETFVNFSIIKQVNKLKDCDKCCIIFLDGTMLIPDESFEKVLKKLIM